MLYGSWNTLFLKQLPVNKANPSLAVILKLHSAFFRKFLDSPDKTAAINPPCSSPAAGLGNFSKFNYEWVTVVDKDDGVDGEITWHLVDSRKVKVRTSQLFACFIASFFDRCRPSSPQQYSLKCSLPS